MFEMNQRGGCTRCHVMEVESFESEEVAKLMNDHFVNIKVCTRSHLFLEP